MKIIPQNGHLLVEMIGRGDYTTKANILIKVAGSTKPNIDEVTRFKILEIPEVPIEDSISPFVKGQVICAQGLFCKEIAKRNPVDEGEKQRYYVESKNVISVIEEETENVN